MGKVQQFPIRAWTKRVGCDGEVSQPQDKLGKGHHPIGSINKQVMTSVVKDQAPRQ